MSRSGPAALAWWYLLGWLCSSSTGAGVHAVLETSFAGRVQEQVVPTRKGCPRPCINKGHCNHEKGRCECPWGYAGDACEVDRMAACRQTPDDPGSCGFISPKNCECFRECFRLYCSRYGTQTHKCSAGWGFDIGDSPCWLYGSGGSAANGTAAGGGGGSSVAVLPAAAQNSSAYPEDPENNTVWYSQIPELYGQTEYKPDMLLKDVNRKHKSPYDRPHLVWHRANHRAHPLSRCGASRCSNGRGFCLQYDGRPEPECVCHFGFNGTQCEQGDNWEACWFSPDCGGHGTCHSGFCSCKDGRWGIACHRSAAVAPAVPGTIPDMRVATRFKIYMYDLPWDVAFPFEVQEDAHGRDPMYTAYEYFLKYFITDNIVRTENPYEAHLFYVPALNFFYSGNLRPPEYHLEAVMDHVKTAWPFYNRSGGRDHFIFLTGDRGACHMPRDMQDSMIKVVHFGMQKQGLNWTSMEHNKEYGCIRMRQDLVVPPHPNDHKPLWPVGAAAYFQRIAAAGGHDAGRNITFLFAGGVGEGEYSGGTRQAVRALLLNITDPAIMFVEGRRDDYVDLLWRSQFCLAAYGHGWGIRVMQSIQFGCIPVIIQDHVYQAFEDFLPYEEFSVRLPLRDVPRLLELLRSYSPEQLAALRLGMAKYFRAFIWNRDQGGEAFEWTLAGLQRRAANMHAGLFRRHRRRRHV
ncbi:hypothetical protein CHLRE_03g202550v5 [Chlamydomonas reinhardtii]|uniref:EGF-like domain-containing protein n=1 Tax=Chlamydomonas reinhardtii TaxID=3055 RepID=A0A2K3DZ84_CHLRE|nr:uncharacterized protein CHLRE_03g202550v5 [Chlamydomonas reinhardtii]PNW85856.1 hypothetical protein CHLRE_03g202550v5 [Chlamydomonas reinhardtii]